MPRTEQELLNVVYERSTAITRRRRVSVASITAACVIFAIAVPYALLSGPGDEVVLRPMASHTTSSDTPASDDDAPDEAEVDGEQEPAAEPPTQADRGPKERARAAAPAMCDPWIVDDMFDTKDARLDTVEVSVDYDGDERLLTFAYALRDLTGTYSTGERVEWDIVFTLEDRRYTVRTSHASDPFGESTSFEVSRGSTLGDGGRPVPVAQPTGMIDDVTDRITIEMSLASFNQGEAALSMKEGRDPVVMEEGSALRDPQAASRTTKLATDDADTATGSCDYVL